MALYYFLKSDQQIEETVLKLLECLTTSKIKAKNNLIKNMKKSLMSVYLAIIILVSAIVFVACNNDEISTESSKEKDFLSTDKSFSKISSSNENFIKPEMYGVYHNELLGIYYKNHSINENISFKTIFKTILNDFRKIHSNTITEAEIAFYTNRIDEMIGENTLVSRVNYNTIITNSINKYCSVKLQDTFIDLLNNTQDPKTVLARVNSLMNDKTISKEDIDFLKKFKSVYHASMIFWKDKNISTTNKLISNSEQLVAPCDPMHQVFFSDAVGCMFGGLGSVGMSWAIYTLQGGHCL